MDADLDALATRLYVTIDDLLVDHPEWRPEGPAVGISAALLRLVVGWRAEAIRWALEHQTADASSSTAVAIRRSGWRA